MQTAGIRRARRGARTSSARGPHPRGSGCATARRSAGCPGQRLIVRLHAAMVAPAISRMGSATINSFFIGSSVPRFMSASPSIPRPPNRSYDEGHTPPGPAPAMVLLQASKEVLRAQQGLAMTLSIVRILGWLVMAHGVSHAVLPMRGSLAPTLYGDWMPIALYGVSMVGFVAAGRGRAGMWPLHRVISPAPRPVVRVVARGDSRAGRSERFGRRRL